MGNIEIDISDTTAAACARLAEEGTCEGCEIEGRLLCLHSEKDLADFGLLVGPPLISFFIGMVKGRHFKGLAWWLALAAVFFGYVEALILCRHCPAYLEEHSTLRCHANWGLPKFPEFDPRPMSRVEQVAWLLYAGVLFLYYIPFFLAGKQWRFLAVTTVTTFIAAWEVNRTECNRCFMLSCPVNRVPEDVKKAFFKNYPMFAESYGVKTAD